MSNYGYNNRRCQNVLYTPLLPAVSLLGNRTSQENKFMVGDCWCFGHKTASESSLIFPLNSKAHSLLMAEVA